MKNETEFRVVPDTNVIVAAELAKNEQSPTKEFAARWLKNEFILLYSTDTLLEYIKKLRDKRVAREKIAQFISDISHHGEAVEISRYHLPSYPQDKDDVWFLLCAENGNGTHLVSYDQHLLELQGKFGFKILKLIPFLKELRAKM